jgi:hypothetical protein
MDVESSCRISISLSTWTIGMISSSEPCKFLHVENMCPISLQKHWNMKVLTLFALNTSSKHACSLDNYMKVSILLSLTKVESLDEI